MGPVLVHNGGLDIVGLCNKRVRALSAPPFIVCGTSETCPFT